MQVPTALAKRPRSLDVLRWVQGGFDALAPVLDGVRKLEDLGGFWLDQLEDLV